jgi:hypothetical protein
MVIETVVVRAVKGWQALRSVIEDQDVPVRSPSTEIDADRKATVRNRKGM